MRATAYAPSTFQQAIYDWIQTGEGSAVIIAMAGSGKTSTLIDGLRYRPADQAARLFAFNTEIANELKARTVGMRGVAASTLHAAGYGALCQKLGMQKIPVLKGQSKSRAICWDWLSRRDAYRYTPFLCELVSLAKGAGVGALLPDEVPEWRALIRHHDLTLDDVRPSEYADVETYAIGLARELLLRTITAAEDDFQIDFDDMLYLPLFWDLILPRSLWVCLDEAQDTNPVRRALVQRSLALGGRLVSVGDSHQSIFGFTGASIDAIDRIIETFHATTLPLSICYRCARAIVEAAQAIVPDILPADDADPGEVLWLPVQQGLAELGPQDVILCRNTAPLVRAAYWLIAHQIGCRILGKEIGTGLVKLVEQMHAETLDQLERELYDYRDQQTAKLRARGESGHAATLDDRVSCIQTVINNLPREAHTVPALKAELIRLFEDQNTGVLTLSTIHKAKGKEWPTVAILQPELMPSPWATQAWERQQETNLRYVAITRARERLIWLNGKLEE